MNIILKSNETGNPVKVRDTWWIANDVVTFIGDEKVTIVAQVAEIRGKKEDARYWWNRFRGTRIRLK